MKLPFKLWVAILIISVIVIHALLLRVILDNGFTTEEWLLLFDYKTAIPGVDLLDKFYQIFHSRGIYFTTYIMYIGILEALFKDNYEAYQYINIFLKILASLSVFPLVLVVFKRRLLAFLTTILYSISYSSMGALQFIVKGTDYLAIFFMNICLITYFYSFKKDKKFLLATSALLFISFIFSPIRIYPLIIFISLFEFFFWIKKRGLGGLKNSLIRLLLILFPLILIFLAIVDAFPKFTITYMGGPLVVLKFVKEGNYQLLLSPFAGFGYTFLTNDYWPLFGELRLDRFLNYLSFLIHGPLIIYSLLAIFLGFLITKKPSNFIAKIIIINISFQVLFYFLITQIRIQTGPNVKEFYSVSTYAIFFGFFVISIAVMSLLLWLRDQKAHALLKPIFIGPLFANIFLWGTWLIIGDNLTFKEGIHWYLIIPPIGTSLFIAGLMELIIRRICRLKLNINYKKILILSVLLLLIPVYIISSREINKTFIGLREIGYGADDQEKLTNKLTNYTAQSISRSPKLFYFEIDGKQQISDTFYYNALSLVVGFEQRMHFRNLEITDGCIGVIHEKDKLVKSIVSKDKIKGFSISSLCVYNHLAVERKEVFYQPSEFYAFKLRDKEFIDIKEKILNELGF